MLDNVEVLIHSSIRINKGLVIYFDPGFNVQIENINYSPKFMCLENSKSLVVKGLTPSLIARTKIEFDRPVRGFQ